MAKENREMAWLQCTSCNDLNYRTEIKVAGGVQKIEVKKYCPRLRRACVPPQAPSRISGVSAGADHWRGTDPR